MQLFVFLSILIPYLAPSMPAWAGYTADIGLLLYAMYRPGKFYLPMLHLIVSYSAYANVINGTSKLPMSLYAVILLAVLTDVEGMRTGKPWDSLKVRKRKQGDTV